MAPEAPYAVTLREAQEVRQNAERLYSRAEVEDAIRRMAETMTRRLHDQNPLFLIVMVGGAIPAGMLLPYLNFELQVDYIHATRYAGATAGGTIQWLRRPATSLDGRTVVILDDVLDEGLTLAEIVNFCKEAGAAAVLTAVLVEKNLPRPGGLPKADFTALQTDNRYLFGCGMDYKTYLRNADGIYAVQSS